MLYLLEPGLELHHSPQFFSPSCIGEKQIKLLLILFLQNCDIFFHSWYWNCNFNDNINYDNPSDGVAVDDDDQHINDDIAVNFNNDDDDINYDVYDNSVYDTADDVDVDDDDQHINDDFSDNFNNVDDNDVDNGDDFNHDDNNDVYYY